MPEKVFQLTPERNLKTCTFQDIPRPEEAVGDAPLASWIDIDHHDPQLLGNWFAALELHPLAIEACLDPVPVSGLVVYGNSLFIGFPIQPTWDAGERIVLRIICLPRVIITVHDKEIPTLCHIAQRYGDGLRFHSESSSAILYQILDHVIDEDMAFTLRTREAVSRLEELLDEDSDDELTAKTLPLKLIAGVYGMNFRNMPELAWRFGYAGVLVVMTAVACGMLWGFYRAGWFR